MVTCLIPKLHEEKAITWEMRVNESIDESEQKMLDEFVELTKKVDVVLACRVSPK